MRALNYVLILLLLGSTGAWAAPASEASIKELLAVTQAPKLLEGVRGQFDSLMEHSIQNALNGRTPTEAQEQAITKMKNRMVALLQSELTWEKLEPMYLRLYAESFSEDEIAGMLAFYRSPSGQAVIQKMPVLLQNTMGEMQKMIAGVMPQMQKIQQDLVAELKAAGAQKP